MTHKEHKKDKRPRKGDCPPEPEVQPLDGTGPPPPPPPPPEPPIVGGD